MASTRVANAQTLGHLIREGRTRHNLSQRDLADAMGVHQRVVVDLELGRSTKALERMFAALRETGIDLRAQVRDETNTGQTRTGEPSE